MSDIVVSVNEQKLKELLEIYKKNFWGIHWEQEKYKWEGVAEFQDKWDITAVDFYTMFYNATKKVSPNQGGLFDSQSAYPRTNLKTMYNADPQGTRQLFDDLFDEQQPYDVRIKNFLHGADSIWDKIDTQDKHYQKYAVMTYLWLKYPDRYFIYKYSICRGLAKQVDSTYVPIKGTSDSIVNSQKFYDKICTLMKNDKDINAILKDCNKQIEFKNPNGEFAKKDYKKWLNTIVTDFAYYVDRYLNLSRNLIYFGAPGTGKSYILNKTLYNFISIDKREYYYERVTFYPDYTYADFVGSYRPVSDDEGNIRYEYVPGPFMRILKKALFNKNKSKSFVLVIEEINRANLAAVFGNVFQLLDRRCEDVLNDRGKIAYSEGESEYPIDLSEEMKAYLKGTFKNKKDSCVEDEKYIYADVLGNKSKIIIPSNMYIWATMNSADQGVYPMDTAFKRRWDFKYIDIDNGEEDIKGKRVWLGGKPILWNELRKAINERLVDLGINEDKLLGAHFIKSVPEVSDNEYNSELFCEVFKDKVLMYLFEDAARYKRKELFADEKDAKQYSKLCKSFDDKGIDIFCKEIADNKEIIYSES